MIFRTQFDVKANARQKTKIFNKILTKHVATIFLPAFKKNVPPYTHKAPC